MGGRAAACVLGLSLALSFAGCAAFLSDDWRIVASDASVSDAGANVAETDAGEASSGAGGSDSALADSDDTSAEAGDVSDGAQTSDVSTEGALTDTGTRDDSDGASTSFTFLVTETPPSSPAPSLWGGVLQFSVAGDGLPLVVAGGIDAGAVADPVGLAFRPTSSEVFVGNRHGNNAGNGVAGSISRFVWNGSTKTLTPNGAITGNGLNAVHQVAFNPVTGELFAANHGGGGVSRFTFDGSGNAVANGTIGDGAAVGVNVGPNGGRLYITFVSTVIRQFDLLSGAELAAVTVPSPAALHQMAFRGSAELYVADSGGAVVRFAVDPSGNLVLTGTVTGADSPLGVAFSPDGLEMFTGGHGVGIIDRYRYDAPSDSWISTPKVNAPASLGYMLVLP